MINDEQIAELIANYEAPAHIWKNDVTFAREYAFEFARSLVALAQQVKPLEFVRDDDGDLVAHCSYGVYCVMPCWIVDGKLGVRMHIGSELPGHIDFNTTTPYQSVEHAVEAAQDIHKAKILRELVHGGGNVSGG